MELTELGKKLAKKELIKDFGEKGLDLSVKILGAYLSYNLVDSFVKLDNYTNVGTALASLETSTYFWNNIKHLFNKEEYSKPKFIKDFVVPVGAYSGLGVMLSKIINH